MLIYFEGQTFPPVPFSGARLEVCNLWEAICQCKEREQKSLPLNEWVYLPLILLIGFLTKYCHAQQRAALSSIQELLISADKTSYFIVSFQSIVKFLKASGKRWFLFFPFFFLLCFFFCFFKPVHAKVLTRWSPVQCICWHISLPFWKSVLIVLVFCFVPSSNNSTLTMHVRNSTKSYFYVLAGLETTLFCDLHPYLQLPAEIYSAYSTG